MRNLLHLLIITLSTALVAISYNWFFVPHHLVSGGVGGIALLTNHFLGWPVGLQVLLYNIPILVWGWRDLGRRFLVLTVVGILALTVLTTLIPIRPLITDDPMLNAIFGGLINGIGAALALRIGGSLGGLDIAAISFNRKFSLPIGDLLLGFNALVVGAAGLLGDARSALYTLVAMFVSSKVLDVVTRSVVKKTVLIVTRQSEAVAQRIHREMGRGATILDGLGAYSKANTTVLLCVVTRYEVAQLKEITGLVDPQGFAVVLSTDEVLGRFLPYNVVTRSVKHLV